MLKLRPFRPSDAAIILTWVKDEVVFRKWVADRYDHYPITPKDMIIHYDVLRKSHCFYPMTAVDDSGVVGHLILRYTDEDKKTLRLGFIIVDDSKRSMGYGRAMVELTVKYGFDVLKADKITLGVFENNENAHCCYQAAGFRDIKLERTETYSVLGEEWKCLEMELEQGVMRSEG